MSSITILVISVLVGLVAAGFTWYGWNIVENFLAIHRARKTAQPETPAPDEPEAG
jgi:hypothetical protein